MSEPARATATGRRRPRLYNQAYCEALVQHCQRGGSVSSFAVSIGVSLETLTAWCKDDAEFANAWEWAFSELASQLEGLMLAQRTAMSALWVRVGELEPDFRALAASMVGSDADKVARWNALMDDVNSRFKAR